MTEVFAASPQGPAPRRGSGFSPARVVGSLLGGAAWAGALAIGALLAVLVAFGLILVGAISAVVLAFAMAGVKARQGRSRSAGPEGVLEARHLGGHSWVAYGWDQSA